MAILRVLFGGSRFVAWVLVPALAIFAAVMLATADGFGSTSGAIRLALAGAALLLALALAGPRRFRWAGRAVAGAVFLAYAAYAVGELLFSGHPFLGKGRGEPSPANALAGLAFIGLPALWYAVRGRFGRDDEPMALAADDPLILGAVECARGTLRDFLRLYPDYHDRAAVKLAFTSDAGAVEHVWAEVVDLRPDEVSVRLITPPVSQRGPVPERIQLPLGELEDWQVFLPDGAVRGGFSTQAMIAACWRGRLPIPRALRGFRFLDPLRLPASARTPPVRG